MNKIQENSYGCDVCGKRKDWDEGIIWITSGYGVCEQCYDTLTGTKLKELQKEEHNMNKIQETKAREMSTYTTKALELLREVQQTEETNYLRNKMFQQLEYYEMLLFEKVEYDHRALAAKTRLAQAIIEKYN